MTMEEDQLNEEIARLEAELEQARLESQLKHLQAQLALAEGEGGDVVEEWEEDQDYEEYEDEEVTEEEYEDEEYEEVYEEGKLSRRKNFLVLPGLVPTRYAITDLGSAVCSDWCSLASNSCALTQQKRLSKRKLFLSRLLSL